MSLASLAFAQRRLNSVAAWEATVSTPRGPFLLVRHIRLWLWRAGIWAGAGISLAVDWLTTGLGPWLEIVDSTAGWLLSVLLAPFELLFSLPYLGRGLSMLWRGALSLIWAVVRIPEALLFLVGIAPEKRLRLWLLIPGSDMTAEQRARFEQSVQAAADILLRQANVRLVSTAGFSRTFALAGSNPEPIEWRTPPESLPLQQLEVGCLMAALIEDLGRLGGALERAGLRCHLRGAYRRLTGWGAPLMAVAVGSVESGRLAGCSLGPLTDYVTIDHNQPICLAHEIGHACNLPHANRAGNLMNATCGGVHMSAWQAMLLRMSRHVTFL